MTATRWSEDKSVVFINVYEKYECLWNSKSKDYRNKAARVAATNKLICGMKELGITMTSYEVKTRIKTIRTTYMAELRKVKKSQMSGDDLYVPTAAWFAIADRFLRDVVSIRPVFENLTLQSTQNANSLSLGSETIREVNNPQVDSGNNSIVDLTYATRTVESQTETMVSELTTSHDVPNCNGKRTKSYDTSFAAITKLQKICDTANEAIKEDEFDIFSKHVATQLRNIDILRAIEVQKQISILLSEARIQYIKEKHRERTPSKISWPESNNIDDSTYPCKP